MMSYVPWALGSVAVVVAVINWWRYKSRFIMMQNDLDASTSSEEKKNQELRELEKKAEKSMSGFLARGETIAGLERMNQREVEEAKQCRVRMAFAEKETVCLLEKVEKLKRRLEIRSEALEEMSNGDFPKSMVDKFKKWSKRPEDDD